MTKGRSRKYPDWIYEELKKKKIKLGTFHKRIEKGASFEEALKPVRPKKKTCWLVVTSDKYELPLIVCDTAEELADYLGVERNSIYVMKSRKHAYTGKIAGRKIRKVKIEC